MDKKTEYRNNFLEILTEILGKENVLIDEALKKHSTFRVGGPADFLVMPCTQEQIISLVKFLKEENTKYYVLGNGSNIIFQDKGFGGVVIKIGKKMGKIEAFDEILISESGALLPLISSFALSRGLSGVEFLSLVPGTLGGAITMNAGAYGFEIKDILIETVFLNENQEISVFNNLEHKFEYRKSIFEKNGKIILKSKLRLKKEKKDKIEERINLYKEKRFKSQPVGVSSAGSIFKKPFGEKRTVWELIDKTGLRGARIGGAVVSIKHAGFIVNDCNATSKNIIDLINLVQYKVHEKFKVKLEPEVKIIE